MKKKAVRVPVCDCAARNEYCNLLNLDKRSLILSCIMSFRARYGELEICSQDLRLFIQKKVNRNEINTAW